MESLSLNYAQMVQEQAEGRRFTRRISQAGIRLGEAGKEVNVAMAGSLPTIDARRVERAGTVVVDMFLKMKNPDVTGEATDVDHKGEIDVVSWSWGFSHRGT